MPLFGNELRKQGALLLKRTNRALDTGKIALGAAEQPPVASRLPPFLRGNCGRDTARRPEELLDDGLTSERRGYKTL
jgi:hypothetical protein